MTEPTPRTGTAAIARRYGWHLADVRPNQTTWACGPRTIVARWDGEEFTAATGDSGGADPYHIPTLDALHRILGTFGRRPDPVPVTIAGIRAGEVQETPDGFVALPLCAPPPQRMYRTEVDAAIALAALLPTPDAATVARQERALTPGADPQICAAVGYARALLATPDPAVDAVTAGAGW
jgi:hypothetical protein